MPSIIWDRCGCDFTKPLIPYSGVFFHKRKRMNFSLLGRFTVRLALAKSVTVRKDATQSPASCCLPCWRKMSGYFGHEASVVVVFVRRREEGRRASPGPLSGLDFFFFTVKADCSVTECLRAISIIMLGRDGDPFHPPALPPHTALQRDDTSPPARLPPPNPPTPPTSALSLICWLTMFFPRWCCVFL